jgi:hypothetical protein
LFLLESAEGQSRSSHTAVKQAVLVHRFFLNRHKAISDAQSL